MAAKNDKRGILATTSVVEQFEHADRLPWPIGAACNSVDRSRLARSRWAARDPLRPFVQARREGHLSRDNGHLLLRSVGIFVTIVSERRIKVSLSLHDARRVHHGWLDRNSAIACLSLSLRAAAMPPIIMAWRSPLAKRFN